MSKFSRYSGLVSLIILAGAIGWSAGYFFIAKVTPELAVKIENQKLARQIISTVTPEIAPALTPAVLGEKIENPAVAPTYTAPASTSAPAALQNSASSAPTPASSIKIFLAGDVMLSRMVEKRSLAQTSTEPFSYPFANFKNQIAAADLAFANLETPLIAGAPVSATAMLFRADPQWAPALSATGFDALSLANNHILNQKQAGLLKTQELLARQGIAACGIGNASTSGAVIIPVKDLKIGLACYTYDGAKTAGKNLAPEGLTAENLKRDLTYLKSQKADFIIVSMHAGAEYQDTAAAQQTTFARQAIDFGADLVVGHHPHVVQNMELYKDKYIFYSLGNFIFDQNWSDATRRGLALTLTIKPHETVAIEYLPLVIENYSQPRPANPAESSWILKRLQWAAAMVK